MNRDLSYLSREQRDSRALTHSVSSTGKKEEGLDRVVVIHVCT